MHAVRAREVVEPVVDRAALRLQVGDQQWERTDPAVTTFELQDLTAWLDEVAGRAPTHVSALEVAIRPDLRGTGLASVMLEAKRANVARLGFTDLVAPVRPSRKSLEPLTPMPEYAARVRAALVAAGALES